MCRCHRRETLLSLHPQKRWQVPLRPERILRRPRTDRGSGKRGREHGSWTEEAGNRQAGGRRGDGKGSLLTCSGGRAELTGASWRDEAMKSGRKRKASGCESACLSLAVCPPKRRPFVFGMLSTGWLLLPLAPVTKLIGIVGAEVSVAPDIELRRRRSNGVRGAKPQTQP